VLVADALGLEECLVCGNRLGQMLAGDHAAIGSQERGGLRAGCWGLKPPADLGMELTHAYCVPDDPGKLRPPIVYANFTNLRALTIPRNP
jgi:hypothetical protein